MRRQLTAAIALWTLACGDPLAPEPPSETPIINAPSTTGGDAPADSGETAAATTPPSATLRAPADDRRQEVHSQTGAAPP